MTRTQQQQQVNKLPGPLHDIAIKDASPSNICNNEMKQATDDDAIIIDVDACITANKNNDHRSHNGTVLQHNRPSSSSSHHNNKRRRKKQSYTKVEVNLNEKLSSFQHSPHHLRISASSIAALCGLHPYQNLPQLLFDYVYQSSIGQLLLQQDARALGFTLVDGKTHERSTMLHLASKTGNTSQESKETKELVQQILEVSDGKRTLKSIEEVQSIQTKITTQARKALKSGKLSKRQVDALVESSRGHVNTGFGTCHEDEALDVYERQNGCCVRERNEALMEWHFVRSGSSSSIIDRKKKGDGNNDDNGNGNDNGELLGNLTAVPMGKAKRRVWKRWNKDADTKREECGKAKKRESGTESDPIEIKDNDDGSVDGEDVVEPANDDDNDSINENKVENCAGASSSSTTSTENKPFFRIVGAVDGIRDELYMDSSKPPAPETAADSVPPVPQPPPPANTTTTSSTHNSNSAYLPKNTSHDNDNNSNNDTRDEYNFSDDDVNDDSEEDQWTLRPIIVECKHRMKEAKVPPPLYDQIQTCLYCHMYNVEEADLIQVVRRKKRKAKKKNGALNQRNGNRDDDDSNTKRKSGITTNTSNGDQSDIQITTTRISLDDPIHNHKYHWKATLLPRIASFVDAVYNVRKDDGKRYRLLTLLVRSQQQMAEGNSFDDCGGGGGGDADGDTEEEELWKVLWEECPWLMHCDTAFGKNSRRF